VTTLPAPDPGREAVLAIRDQLSSLQGLLALSMRMTDSGDEEQIVRLAVTSVPALGHCQLVGIYLGEGGWRPAEAPSPDGEVRIDVESQLGVVGAAGGAVGVIGQRWGWAFPLRSLGGHFGYLVVSADVEPPPQDQFLLRVLSQQTGVALANAHLHARERGSATDLQALNAALNDTVAALERSTSIHERLTRVAVGSEGEEGIAQAVHELTGLAVAIEDRHGNLRAWAGPDRPDPYPKDPPARRDALLRQARHGEPITDAGRVLAVVSPRDEVLGVLALIDPDGVAGDQGRAALEHGATVLGMELAHLQSLAESELRLGRELVQELLAGVDEPRVFDRARAMGFDFERPHRVVVVDGSEQPSDDNRLFEAVRRAMRKVANESLLARLGEWVQVLTDPDLDWDKVRDAVAEELGSDGFRMAVGGVCDRPADFARSYREAKLALRLQDRSSDVRTTSFEQLGVYRILAGVEDTEDVERFVHDWLGSLIDYDLKRSSELVPTLSRYLECGKSYDATAEALSVHRSTLKYRLQRIREISQHDLADPDTCFNLMLASRAWRTLLALRGDS
jgi:sugar diacid utilization regulator